MAKNSPQVDETLFVKSPRIVSQPQMQTVMPVSAPAEKEATILFRSDPVFAADLDLYIANHQPQLNEFGNGTKKSFCRYVLKKYMDEHP